MYDEGQNITAICPGWVESRMAKEANILAAIAMSDIILTVKWLLQMQSRVREILMEVK